jgi:ubiquinone/menaquinone biosynthesis C-methylase UbiE
MEEPDHIARSNGRFGPAALSRHQAASIRRERLFWGRRAASWDQEGSAGLTDVFAAVIAACGDVDGAEIVDLGAGSGLVTVPLARSCRRMLAVDVSAPALAILQDKARAGGLDNIEVRDQPIESLELGASTVDLVVTNYALHHLRDADKRQVLERAFTWLRPGGRLVIGDMMFGRGTQAGDRAIIASKVRVMARRGPAGWWRIAKNVVRFTVRLREKPIEADTWRTLVAGAGFERVRTRRVVAEACVLDAVKPEIAPGAGARPGVLIAASPSGSPDRSPGADRAAPVSSAAAGSDMPPRPGAPRDSRWPRAA